MSVDRKRHSFNQDVNERHERKVLKDEETRLKRLGSVVKKQPSNMVKEEFGYDFAALELRTLAYFCGR